jgi:hypothetical protein
MSPVGSSLLQEEMNLKVLHHLEHSEHHWDSVKAGMNMKEIADMTDFWQEDSLASIVWITVCKAVVRCCCMP